MNAVRLLSEAMDVYGLSPEQAAGYVGCSGSQIRRWLAGRFKPTPVYVQAIAKGVKRMETELTETEGTWRRQPEDEPPAEELFRTQMKHVFAELEPRLTREEKYINFIANPDSWNGFVSFLSLIRKYEIELPK